MNYGLYFLFIWAFVLCDFSQLSGIDSQGFPMSYYSRFCRNIVENGWRVPASNVFPNTNAYIDLYMILEAFWKHFVYVCELFGLCVYVYLVRSQALLPRICSQSSRVWRALLFQARRNVLDMENRIGYRTAQGCWGEDQVVRESWLKNGARIYIYIYIYIYIQSRCQYTTTSGYFNVQSIN